MSFACMGHGSWVWARDDIQVDNYIFVVNEDQHFDYSTSYIQDIGSVVSLGRYVRCFRLRDGIDCHRVLIYRQPNGLRQ